MAKPRPYHVLLSREDKPRAPWGVEFGDYDRSCVVFERDDYRSHHKAKNLKIITTGAKQAEIDAAVAALNAQA